MHILSIYFLHQERRSVTASIQITHIENIRLASFAGAGVRPPMVWVSPWKQRLYPASCWQLVISIHHEAHFMEGAATMQETSYSTHHASYITHHRSFSIHETTCTQHHGAVWQLHASYVKHRRLHGGDSTEHAADLMHDASNVTLPVLCT